MKIGVLTLPLHTNYGGILQAYALTKFLTKTGHEVTLLDQNRYPTIPLLRRPFAYLKRFVKKYILGKSNTLVFMEKIKRREYLIIGENTEKFVNQYIKHRTAFDSFEQLSETDFDAIIVGSDQIWRPKYVKRIENSFLEFTETWTIKRIAYAPSFGTDSCEFSKEQLSNCKSLLQKFDALSVRELSGIELCKQYFDVDAFHALDPTMLLDKEDYIHLIEARYPTKKQYDLFAYILDSDEEKEEMILNIAKIFNYEVTRASTDNPNAPLNHRIAPPIEEWLNSFYSSKFIVTDSFHACVFSILFNKPFLAYGNSQRGLARFNSLLETFGLEDRLVLSANELSIDQITKPVDWNQVNQTLAIEREKSTNFLSKEIG